MRAAQEVLSRENAKVQKVRAIMQQLHSQRLCAAIVEKAAHAVVAARRDQVLRRLAKGDTRHPPTPGVDRGRCTDRSRGPNATASVPEAHSTVGVAGCNETTAVAEGHTRVHLYYGGVFRSLHKTAETHVK